MTPKPGIDLVREIGERLRYARNSAGLSLSQLSELTGGTLSKSRISNYEQGLRNLSIEAARGLAEALGNVSPAYLMCLDDPMNLSADETDLLKTYRATDAMGRARVGMKAEDEAKRALGEEG